MNNSVKNILIVRTDRIGDVVLTLPLAGIIKKHYPDCRVTFLVKDYTKEILFNHPYVDKVIILSENNDDVDFFENIKKISSENFDSCIVVNPTFKISLILFLSGIKKRIGTGYRWYSFLFNKKVFEHRKYAEKHELEFNVNLLKEIGINENVNKKNTGYNLIVNSEAEKFVIELFKKENILLTKPIIIIHPGSGGSSIDLPLNRFISLMKMIAEDDFQIIVTGNKKEFNICEKLVVSDNVKNYAGKLTISQLVALIDKSELFISNSTGPIHIAAALGKFTVGFYPKILSCSKERWAPFTERKIIYVPEIDCGNCTRAQCERLNCMDSIDMNRVYADIKKILDNHLKLEMK